MGRPLQATGGGYLRRPLNGLFAQESNIAVLRALSWIAQGGTGREIAATIGARGQGLGHLRKILEEKNRVAHTGQSFREADWEALRTHAERFCAWAQGCLKG